jgi:hypothetical protein
MLLILNLRKNARVGDVENLNSKDEHKLKGSSKSKFPRVSGLWGRGFRLGIRNGYRTLLFGMERSKLLSILFLLSIFLSGHAQEMERDSLRKHMFSIGTYGVLESQNAASRYRGTGLEKGVELRSDLALGDAGSGLALGISGFHRSYFWEERERELQEFEHLPFGVHGGYFTRIHPFRWSPRLQGGLSKLRFEYRYDLTLSSLSGAMAGSHALSAAFHHARPLGGTLWLDVGISARYLDQWPGSPFIGNGILVRGLGGGLSLALMIRSGERGAYP